MPRLALCYLWKNYSLSLFNNLVQFYIQMWSGDDSERQAYFGKEIHALSSVSKPYSSWMAQECIQECREACGGHGYLKASRFSYLRNTNDPIQTFEGDNNVLIQQTSNYLLTSYEDYSKTKQSPDTPLNTIRYMNNLEKNLQLRFKANNQTELLSQKSNLFFHNFISKFITILNSKSHFGHVRLAY